MYVDLSVHVELFYCFVLYSGQSYVHDVQCSVKLRTTYKIIVFWQPVNGDCMIVIFLPCSV